VDAYVEAKPPGSGTSSAGDREERQWLNASLQPSERSPLSSRRLFKALLIWHLIRLLATSRVGLGGDRHGRLKP
jgi:hypothetical protein